MAVRRVHSGRDPSIAGEPLYKLAANGTITSMAATGSLATPLKYKFTVPTGRKAVIHRICSRLVDNGIQTTLFGGIGARTNGVKLVTTNSSGTIITNYTTDITMKKNADWALLAGPDGAFETVQGAAEDSFVVRWTLDRAGQNVWLEGGESFEIWVQDDLTSLTEYEVMIQGYYTK